MVIGGKNMATTAVMRGNYFQEGPRLPVTIAESASIEIDDNVYVVGGKDYQVHIVLTAKLNSTISVQSTVISRLYPQ